LPQEKNISQQNGVICVKICNFENYFGPLVCFMTENEAEAPLCGKKRSSEETGEGLPPHSLLPL